MPGRMIEGRAEDKPGWWRRMPVMVWLMLAFFVSLWTLIGVYTNQPKPRASAEMRARLEPIYAALAQRERDARADHPQSVGEDRPDGFFGLAKMLNALPRHAPKGDKEAVDALMSYQAWVDGLEEEHSAAKRAELDATDRKREDRLHRQIAGDVETRLSPRPAYAPPQWFYDYPVLFAIPALLFPAIFISAFGPSVRDGLQRRRLKRMGTPMMGTILSAESTGVTINRVPQLLMRVRLETGEEAEYRKLSLYGFGIAAGTPVQLLVDPRDHTKVTEA